jgi:hypothetical protein
MGFGRKDVTKIEERKEGRKGKEGRKEGRTEGTKERRNEGRTKGLKERSFVKNSNMHGGNDMKEEIGGRGKEGGLLRKRMCGGGV